MTNLFRIAALLAIVGVIYLTLGPVSVRSLSPFPPLWDRSIAFLIIGILLTLSFPRHRILVLLTLVVLVVGLELAQHLRPDRHGQAGDAVVKLLGAVAGLAMAGLSGVWSHRVSRRTAR